MTSLTSDADNQHPVDSTYHPCCNAIGRHGPDCVVKAVDDARASIELAHRGAAAALRALPDEAPLFAVVDTVNAIAHLRAATRLVDRAATAIDRTTAKVTP